MNFNTRSLVGSDILVDETSAFHQASSPASYGSFTIQLIGPLEIKISEIMEWSC